MTQFVAALVVFLALHMVPAIPPLRAGLVGALGRRPYLITYSLVSLLALAWLFHATMRLDFVPLWDAAAWQAWIPLVLTPIGLVFIVAGLLSPNPSLITCDGPAWRPACDRSASTILPAHPQPGPRRRRGPPAP